MDQAGAKRRTEKRVSEVRPPQLAASFSSSRASLIPRQLPASPMMVFPVEIEHALDVTVQCPQQADPSN